MNKEWIYDKDDNNTYRYTLGVKGENPLITFGINPSTAEPGNLDPTVKNTEKLSVHLDKDSWIMLNIYPQRATDPNNMDMRIKEEDHQNNLRYIEKIFRENAGTYAVAAWGNLIEKRTYLTTCLEGIYELSLKYGISWKCIDQNKTGHPKHPLYVSIPKVVLKDFDIQNQYGLMKKVK
jgi:hypothetical protein